MSETTNTLDVLVLFEQALAVSLLLPVLPPLLHFSAMKRQVQHVLKQQVNSDKTQQSGFTSSTSVGWRKLLIGINIC